MRYHVNPKGEVRICRAEVGHCRYGEEGHGDTFDETLKMYEESMKDKNLPTEYLRDEEQEEDPEEKYTYTYSESRYFQAIKNIEKANRRLEKAGISERFEYEVSERMVTSQLEGMLFPVSKKVYDLTLNKPLIGQEGYTFQAVVNQEEGGMIMSTAKNTDLKGWRPDSLKCEHCGISRPRSKTYIIKGPDGKLHQIGSSCVQSYLGIKPEGLWSLTFDPTPKETDDSDPLIFSKDSAHSYHLPVKDVLAISLAVTNGGKAYVSASAWDGVPTKQLVADVLYGGRNVDQAWREEMFAKAQEYSNNGEIDKVKEYINTLDSQSDYGANLQALSKSDWFSPKHTGLLASAVVGPYREEMKLAAAEARKKKGETFTHGHYLTPKEKIPKGTKFTVMENKVRLQAGYGYYDNDHNASQMIMKDEEGHQIVWWANKELDYKPGDEITVSSGSVKYHGEYNGVDQTIITRVRILEG